MTSAYFRGAEGFLLVYDVSNSASFKAVRFWSDQIINFTWNMFKVILVANKMGGFIALLLNPFLGSGPEGVDDLCFPTYEEFSPSSPPPLSLPPQIPVSMP